MGASKLSLKQRLAAWVAALVAALALVGCHNDDAVAPTARATLGAAGGSVSSPDGSLVLTIPAGALGNDTEITITEVATDAVPEHLKALGGDRVYLLGPAGTQFAQPVTAAVTLAAGNQLAVMLIDGGGATSYAGNQQVVINAQGRRVLGTLTHFSHLVTRTVGSFTAESMLDKRQLKVGETLVHEFKLSKTDSEEDGTAWCSYSPLLDASTVLELTSLFGDACNAVDFVRGTAMSVVEKGIWRCKAPGTEVLRSTARIQGLARLFLLPTIGFADVNVVVEQDVVCTEGEAPAGLVAGVHKLAIGTLPDGMRVYQRNSRWLMWLAIAQGLLVYDLLSGLLEHNLTGTGLGAVGRDNLDVQAIEHNGVEAVFAAGPAEGALRNRIAGVWGFTLLALGSYFDAANAGNRLDAPEMVLVSPISGLSFARFDAVIGAFAVRPDLALSRFLFLGSLASAALAFDAAGGSVLALTTGTEGGAKSTVWWHGRASVLSPAIPLFSIADPLARRLRCARLPDGKLLCIVTAQLLGKAFAFVVDPAAPETPLVPVELPVGNGPVGLHFSTDADGLPVAVVANYSDASVNFMRFGAAGQVLENRRIALPAGCSRSAHAVALLVALQWWLVGTCTDDNAYYVAPA